MLARVSPCDDRSVDFAERAARNEEIFRGINARIEEGVARHGVATAVPYHCECGDGSCFETVALMPSEYEQVLRERYRFMIVPGHENPAIERVVEHHSTHLVVEKIGEARDQLDRDHRRARAARALRMTTSNRSPSSTLTGSEPA
jgi:hypothetical protein